MSTTLLSPGMIGIVRAAIGAIQGLALYLIYLAYEERVWPATDGLVFAPLLLIAFFVPPLERLKCLVSFAANEP